MVYAVFSESYSVQSVLTFNTVTFKVLECVTFNVLECVSLSAKSFSGISFVQMSILSSPAT